MPNFNPNFAILYNKLTPNTPKPYLQERIKFIEDASLKYFVGHEISPILKFLKNSKAKISLSKIKSSLQVSKGKVSKTSLVNPLKPVWYYNKVPMEAPNPEKFYMEYVTPLDVDLTSLEHYPSIEISKNDLQ